MSLFVAYFRIISSHLSFILFHESKNVSHPNVSFLNQKLQLNYTCSSE